MKTKQITNEQVDEILKQNGAFVPDITLTEKPKKVDYKPLDAIHGCRCEAGHDFDSFKISAIECNNTATYELVQDGAPTNAPMCLCAVCYNQLG